MGTINSTNQTAKQPNKSAIQMRQLLLDLSNNKYKNVIVMAGAGISTASGIPDFRSPKTGLYANLQKFNLPYPEAVFDIDYLRKNPNPFFMLCSEMYPSKFKPTRIHYFIKWLSDLNVLKRCYTQNIDTLERKAGLIDDLVVEAHGSFARNFCIDCKKEEDTDLVKKHILAKKGPYICKHCNGIVKPAIVFFGEDLPPKFFKCMNSDFDEVDLVIVIGTSLQVSPFNQLPDLAPKGTKRYLINFTRAGSLGQWKNDELILGDLEKLNDVLDEFIENDISCLVADLNLRDDNDDKKNNCDKNVKDKNKKSPKKKS